MPQTVNAKLAATYAGYVAKALELEDEAKKLRFLAGQMMDILHGQMTDAGLRNVQTPSGTVYMRFNAFAQYREHDLERSVDICAGSIEAEPNVYGLLGINHDKANMLMARTLDTLKTEGRDAEEVFESKPYANAFVSAFVPAFSITLSVRRRR